MNKNLTLEVDDNVKRQYYIFFSEIEDNLDLRSTQCMLHDGG